MTNDKEPIYKNIIIRMLEIRLAMAERKGQKDMIVSVGVLKDILSLLKEKDGIFKLSQPTTRRRRKDKGYE